MWLQLLCGVLVVYLTKVLWRRWRYDLHMIPSPPSWPLLGHTLQFMSGQSKKQFAIWMRQQLRSLGFPKAMRLDVAGKTMILVTDVEFFNSVLAKVSVFPRSPRWKRLLLPFAGNDEHAKTFLFEQKVTPYVKALRKIYATSVQSSQLKQAMPKLNNVMQKMISVIETKRHEGLIDFQKLSVQFTQDTIGVVAMDANLGGLDGSRDLHKKVIETGHVARLSLASPFHSTYCKLFPNSAAAQQQAKTYNELREEWDALTKEIMQKDDPPEGEMPLWYAIKTLIDPETEKPLTYESLRAELATVVVAGTDTTGHQLAWILAMLASHPRIVEKLLEELKDNGLYGENARDITFEDLGELTYLTAVVKEGMRIAHIAVISAARMVTQDVNLLGYRIPKGTAIIAPSNRAMYSESDLCNPEVVRPERWLSDKDQPQIFKVFSSGPRDCTGQKLAMMEIRFAVVKLIAKYNLSRDISFDELLGNAVDGLVIEAKDGIWLKASPREDSKVQNT